MWMSEARFLMALSSTALHRRTTGASSEARSRSSTLDSSASMRVEVDLVLVEPLHDGVVVDLLVLLRRRVVTDDGLLDGGDGRDHRLDVVASEELDVVDGVQVAGIAHGDDQRRAGARDGDQPVPLTHVLGDQLDDVLVDVELVEVDGLDAVLLAEEVGDLAIRDDAHPRQRVAERGVGLLLFVLGLAQLRQADQLFANE